MPAWRRCSCSTTSGCRIAADDSTVARALTEAAGIQLFVDPVGSRAVLERACELATGASSTLGRHSAWGFLRLVERALAAGREFRDPVLEGFGQLLLGWHELATGRPVAVAARPEAGRERVVVAGAGILLPYI